MTPAVLVRSHGVLVEAPITRRVIPFDSQPAESDLARAAQFIRSVTARSGVECARRVGEYLVEHFYGGDFAQVHRHGRKHASLRALAARDDLGVSPTFLWTAIAVAEQWVVLPVELAESLPLAHHRLLLPVHDRAERVRLARVAVEGRWSVRQLQAEIQRHREEERVLTGARKPGRPPGAGIDRLTRLIAEVAREVERAASEGRLDRLEPDELLAFEEALDDAINRLEDCFDGVKEAAEAVRALRSED